MLYGDHFGFFLIKVTFLTNLNLGNTNLTSILF